METDKVNRWLTLATNLAVYIEELERTGSADVHIQWIDNVAREIRDHPGIREFFLSIEDTLSGTDEIYDRLTSGL